MQTKLYFVFLLYFCVLQTRGVVWSETPQKEIKARDVISFISQAQDVIGRRKRNQTCTGVGSNVERAKYQFRISGSSCSVEDENKIQRGLNAALSCYSHRTQLKKYENKLKEYIIQSPSSENFGKHLKIDCDQYTNRSYTDQRGHIVISKTNLLKNKFENSVAHELLHYFGIPMQINHYPSMYKLVRKCVCEPGAGEVFEKGQENKEAMKKWNICSGKISNFFSQKGDPVYACIDHCFPDLETGSHGHVHNCDNFKEEKISPYNFEKMYTQILPNSKCEGEERWQEYGQSHYQKKIIKLFWKQYEKQRYKFYRREKKVDGFQEEIIRATLSKIKKDPKFKKWLKLQSLYESKSKQQNLQTLFHEKTSPLFFVIYMNNPAFLKSLRKENVKTNIQLNGVSPLEFLLERHSSEGRNTVEMKKLLLAPQSAFEEPKDSGFKLRN